jgi:hypothetical protein
MTPNLGTVMSGIWQGTSIGLSVGGTNNSLTASPGGILWSDSAKLNILAGTSTAGLALLSGNLLSPTWSTLKPITEINMVVIGTVGSNIYTPSLGMQYCDVEICGDGGGSGGAAGAIGQFGASGGGSSGGGCFSLFTAANIGASATVVIGPGGVAGIAGNNPGGNGTGSSFTCSGTGTTMLAGGGNGGGGSPSTVTSTNASGNAGGTASGGNIHNFQGGHSSGGIVVSGVNAIGLPGFGGGSIGFSTSSVNYFFTTVGVTQPGQGAAGVTSFTLANQAGQPGASGYCIIREYISI